jgi:hypothetical protein
MDAPRRVLALDDLKHPDAIMHWLMAEHIHQTAEEPVVDPVVDPVIDPVILPVEIRATEWIRLNPPIDNEISSKYHERYIASGGTLQIVRFCGLVRSTGYISKKTCGVMKWRKEIK